MSEQEAKQEWEPRTPDGHPLDEAVSALQKSIRRGDELAAAYFAVEISKSYHKKVWYRLEIIAHEDIGMADPQAAIYVGACKQQYFDARADERDNTMALINVAVYLARAKKSRMSDYIYNIILAEGFRMDVPDYALDMHTKRGREMGRGLSYFLSEAATLENESDDPTLKKFDELYQKSLGTPYKKWVRWLGKKFKKTTQDKEPKKEKAEAQPALF